MSFIIFQIKHHKCWSGTKMFPSNWIGIWFHEKSEKRKTLICRRSLVQELFTKTSNFFCRISISLVYYTLNYNKAKTLYYTFLIPPNLKNLIWRKKFHLTKKNFIWRKNNWFFFLTRSPILFSRIFDFLCKSELNAICKCKQTAVDKKKIVKTFHCFFPTTI